MRHADSVKEQRGPVAQRAAALAVMPMAFIVVGAWIDERSHLGFTTWRSACRSTGLTLHSLVSFTFDLLPTALVGALLGVMALQFSAAVLWFRVDGPRVTLAAHGGCMLGMVAGLILCLLAPSPLLMLAAELSVAAGAAALFSHWPAKRAAGASVSLPTGRPSNAY
jgi:hypothetical protein